MPSLTGYPDFHFPVPMKLRYFYFITHAPWGDEVFSFSLSFFLRRESASGNWLFGITCCVFFVASKFSSEMQAMFCGRILPSLDSFSCGSDFCQNRLLFAFKFTSPLCDVSRVCDVSIIDLSKMIRASFQAFHYHLIHETYSTVICSESKLRSPPGQNDHSRQKKTTRWTYFFVSIILAHQYTGCTSLVFIIIPRAPCFRTSDSTTWRWAHLSCVPAVPASTKSPVGHEMKNMTSEWCARRPSGKGPTVLDSRSLSSLWFHTGSSDQAKITIGSILTWILCHS